MGRAYRADWQFYMQMYANDPAELAASPYANLFLNDLERDMPACYIAAAEYDPLRDDSATLAAICEQYGTPVRYEVFEASSTRFCTTPRCSMRQTTPRARRDLLPRAAGAVGARPEDQSRLQRGISPLHKH